MSWSFNFNGTADEVGNQFDETRKQAAANGMIESEQRDIDETRDFVMQIAQQYGPVQGSANGYWNTRQNVASSPSNPGGTISSFGSLSVTITAKESA